MAQNKDKIHIIVAYATLERQWEIPVEVRSDCTVDLAIRSSGILMHCPEINLLQNKIGIYSQVVSLNTPLSDGDRIEIYRPLQIDPKKARRKRASLKKD